MDVKSDGKKNESRSSNSLSTTNQSSNNISALEWLSALKQSPKLQYIPPFFSPEEIEDFEKKRRNIFDITGEANKSVSDGIEQLDESASNTSRDYVDLNKSILNDTSENSIEKKEEFNESIDKFINSWQPNDPKEVLNKPTAVQAKIQCSIDVSSFLKPISNLDESFKTITANGQLFIILNELGKGGSSIVYHCFAQKSKKQYAVKVVHWSNEDEIATFVKEVELLERLQKCDRIIKMHSYDIRKLEKRLIIVLEMGDKDLSHIFKEVWMKNKCFPNYMLMFYWMEMLYAVKEIHDNGVIHSDLKPANFLHVGGKLKLIDFGISSSISKDLTSVVKTIITGTVNYMSPEAISNDETSDYENSPMKPRYKISYKSDVWSLGCILYQFVYGITPFHKIGNKYAKIIAITDENHVIDFPVTQYRVAPIIIQTIKDCLIFNIKSRPSINELISRFN